MKTILLRLFATNYGTILRYVVAALLGVLVALAGKLGLELSDIQLTQLAGIVTAVVASSLGEFVLSNQGQSIAELQATLKPLSPSLLIDQWAGPKTLAAAAAAARQIAAKNNG